jgi:hypothetical protein
MIYTIMNISKPLIKLEFYEQDNSTYIKYTIYTSARYGKKELLGCNGDIKTIQLSNGRIIKTNDLWIEYYIKEIPEDAIFGKIIYDLNKNYPINIIIDESFIYLE